MTAIPLVVDLDGTLILTDSLDESALRVVRRNPLNVARMGYWLSGGKASLKHRLARFGEFEPDALPYNAPLIDWLKEERALGRKVVLCSACDLRIAEAISSHLGVFDEVMASDGITNLAGVNKADALERRFGRGQFDYAGNSRADLPVWARARRAIVVNASPTVLHRARGLANVDRVFEAASVGAVVWPRVLRVHQWLKNFLLVVPLFAAHRVMDLEALTTLAFAFFSFSLCASSVYIVNDLFDLDSDRQHPRKRARPFASGALPVWKGVVAAPVVLVAGLALGAFVNRTFLVWLLLYLAITSVYSFGLKRLVLIDCLTLAMLYTLRIVAGAAAVAMGLSFWLLAFAVFLFLSLAFVKRYAELEVQILSGKEKVHGRGYFTSDAPLIQNLGITSGYAAVLVMALYLNSEAVILLYRTPEIIWGAVPVMLFWVSWIWLQAHRGQMHDDPLVFAAKDRTSLATGVVFASLLVAGSVGFPW